MSSLYFAGRRSERVLPREMRPAGETGEISPCSPEVLRAGKRGQQLMRTNCVTRVSWGKGVLRGGGVATRNGAASITPAEALHRSSERRRFPWGVSGMVTAGAVDTGCAGADWQKQSDALDTVSTGVGPWCSQQQQHADAPRASASSAKLELAVAKSATACNTKAACQTRICQTLRIISLMLSICSEFLKLRAAVVRGESTPRLLR
jgi:hypothetical protein